MAQRPYVTSSTSQLRGLAQLQVQTHLSATAKSAVCCLHCLSWKQDMGGCRAMLTQVLAYNFMHLDTLAWHSPVNSKEYTILLSFLIKDRFWYWWKIIKFWYICDSIFIWHKSITCKFSNEIYIYIFVIRYSTQNLVMSHYSASIWPVLPEKDISCFTIMPYSCHCSLAVDTFVKNCFEEWSTARVIFHQTSI